jgi:protoporphyrinogen oxidase
MRKKTAIIIGAGPAGLTAAFELLTRTDIKPIVLEKSEDMGGISRTVNYKGNRMDIGGHRFFSKSDRVMRWWQDVLPMQATSRDEQEIAYQGKTRKVESIKQGPDPTVEDRVMLIRHRVSRIFFLRKFFDYPISLSADTLSKLGLARTVRIGISYMKSATFPIKDESTLEQFFINRFGKELYQTFFKSYTEKVWGIPCGKISAEWGAQRVKGLSIKKAITHFIGKQIKRNGDIRQKDTETSLIEQFLYPKYGPGQMWEEVAKKVIKQGGEILTQHEANKFLMNGDRVHALETVNAATGERKIFEGDYFFSTMPIKELVRALDADVPTEVREIGEGLAYRDFITVGLLLKQLKIRDGKGAALIKDNWIYIQEPDVSVGRMQIFNNWSPYLVADASNVWVGLEYFCNEGDEIWQKPKEQMIELAVSELAKMNMIEKTDVLDATVIHVPKTYPAYFGTYDRFDILQNYLDGIDNLFLVGRNGMHKYNNQDHSMLTAMTAVDNIIEGKTDKSNIWAVNTEQEYHESK